MTFIDGDRRVRKKYGLHIAVAEFITSELFRSTRLLPECVRWASRQLLHESQRERIDKIMPRGAEKLNGMNTCQC